MNCEENGAMWIKRIKDYRASELTAKDWYEANEVNIHMVLVRFFCREWHCKNT